MREIAVRALERVGSPSDPDALVRDLPLAEQQLVEIARAMSQNARIIIFDEPTAVLPRPATLKLLDLMRQLKSEGVGIAFVSHHLDEIEAVCDVVTVLRDGQVVKEFRAPDLAPEVLAPAMVGRDLEDMYPERTDVNGKPVAMQVQGLSAPPLVQGAQFELREGEILGVAGLGPDRASGSYCRLAPLFRSNLTEGAGCLRQRAPAPRPRHRLCARGSQGDGPARRSQH